MQAGPVRAYPHAVQRHTGALDVLHPRQHGGRRGCSVTPKEQKRCYRGVITHHDREHSSMAGKIVGYVNEHQWGSPTRKLIALILADHSDGTTWSTFVGQARIGCEANVTDRTVREHLSAMEKAGLIVRRRRQGPSGGRTSDWITLNREAIAALDRCVLPEDSSGGLPEVDAGLPEVDDRPTGSPLPGNRQRTVRENPLAPAPPGRAKDELWEAMMEACGYTPTELTRSARGAANRAVKELRDIGASPTGVLARAGVFRKRWPDAALTPTALAKQYAHLGSAGNGKPPRVVKVRCADCMEPLDGHDDQLCQTIQGIEGGRT